jgi:hypothetical protein
MKRMTSFIIAASALFIEPVSAAVLEEMPFERKVAIADAIIVGRVETSRTVEHGKPMNGNVLAIGTKFITVSVKGIVKGTVPDQVDIWLELGVPEQNVHNCSEGKEYIFYLKKTIDDRYSIVNGRFGVMEVKD